MATKLPERLRELRVSARMTQEELADRVGYTRQLISLWEKGTASPDVDTLSKLAEIYRVTVDYLLGRQEVTPVIVEQAAPVKAPPATTKLPVVGTIRAGMPIIAQENFIGWEEVPTETIDNPDSFFLIVEGDSMDRAFIPPRAKVLVRRQNSAEEGQIAVVIIDAEDATLKRIHYTNSHIELIPESTNPRHTRQAFPPEDIRILGVVEKVIIDKR
ncbi:MAG: LexA family protein [Armatimonadota bacterium]